MTTASASTLLESTHQTVELDGVTYTVRRLNTRDAFRLGKILSKAMAETGQLITPSMNEEMVGMLIFGSLPHAEWEIYELCGSLINVDAKTFAEELPLESLPVIVEALSENTDIERFLKTCSRLWSADSKMRQAFNKLST